MDIESGTQSFIIKVWLEDTGEDTARASWRGHITHVPSGEKRYLKSDLTFYGLTVPQIRKVTKAFTKDHPDLDRDTLIALVTELWAEPVHERRLVAVELLDHHCILLELVL